MHFRWSLIASGSTEFVLNYQFRISVTKYCVTDDISATEVAFISSFDSRIHLNQSSSREAISFITGSRQR